MINSNHNTQKDLNFWINNETGKESISVSKASNFSFISPTKLCLFDTHVFNFRNSFLSYTQISLSAVIIFVVITIPHLCLWCVRACFTCFSSPWKLGCLGLLFFFLELVRDSVYLHALNSLLLFYRKQLPRGNIFVSWFPWPLRVNKVSPFFNLLRTQRVWACSRQLLLIFPRTSRIPLSQDTPGMNACGCLLGTFLRLLPSSHLDHREGSTAIAPYNFVFKVMNHYHPYVLFFPFFFLKVITFYFSTFCIVVFSFL